MRIKIDEDGYLLIERKGEMVAQTCKKIDGEDCNINNCPYCGDIVETHQLAFGGPSPVAGHKLKICEGTVLEGDIIDERVEHHE
jgi:hypothetical protein